MIPDPLAKVRRVEAHQILPGDVVCIYLPEGSSSCDAERACDTWLRITGLDNPTIVFIGTVRVEVKRPEDVR